ncbi:MAG: hypothetical protein MUO27_00810 [Sedimentisphaerales bacterium]|nr:hypothetical protein [Sedimentisphaerales bacterium]
MFIRLAGTDDWLAKGLREDRVGAVVVTCFLGICAILLLALLYVLLPLIPASLAAIFADAGKDLSAENTHESIFVDILRWLLLLCAPILASYLLHWVYRATQWLIKKSTLVS